jgi:hypothetical protein
VGDADRMAGVPLDPKPGSYEPGCFVSSPDGGLHRNSEEAEISGWSDLRVPGNPYPESSGHGTMSSPDPYFPP